MDFGYNEMKDEKIRGTVCVCDYEPRVCVYCSWPSVCAFEWRRRKGRVEGEIKEDI